MAFLGLGLVLILTCAPGGVVAQQAKAPSPCEALVEKLKTGLGPDQVAHEMERAKAASEIGKLGAEATCGVKALGKATREDPSYAVHQAALDALAALGPLSLDAVPDVLEALYKREEENKSPLNPDQVSDTLVKIGPGAIPHLVPYLRMTGPTSDEDTLDTWGFASNVLRRFKDQAVPALIQALAVPDRRSAAIATLANIGPAAAPATPALVRTYDIVDHPLQKAGILYALSAIGDRACEARDLLKKVSGHPKSLADTGDWQGVEGRVKDLLKKLESCPP